MTLARMLAIDSGGNHHRQDEILVVLRHADVFQILRVRARAGWSSPDRPRPGVRCPPWSFSAAVAAQARVICAHAIGAKVEADAGIVVADRGQRFAAVVGADERHDEFVSYIFVVGVLHALHRIGVRATFGFAVDHRAVGLRDRAPIGGRDPSRNSVRSRWQSCRVVFAHLLLQFLQ